MIMAKKMLAVMFSCCATTITGSSLLHGAARRSAPLLLKKGARSKSAVPVFEKALNIVEKDGPSDGSFHSDVYYMGKMTQSRKNKCTLNFPKVYFKEGTACDKISKRWAAEKAVAAAMSNGSGITNGSSSAVDSSTTNDSHTNGSILSGSSQ